MFWLRNKKIIFQYALLSGSLMCENKVESSQPFMPCYLNEICHCSFVSILFDMMLTVSDWLETLMSYDLQFVHKETQTVHNVW